VRKEKKKKKERKKPQGKNIMVCIKRTTVTIKYSESDDKKNEHV